LKPAAPAKTKTKPARASSPVPRRSSPAIDDVVEIVVRDVEVTAAVAANRCPPDTVTEATTRASGVVVADVDAGTLGVEGASAVQAPPRRDIRDVEDEEELMSSWQTAAETAAPSGTARDPIEIDADAEEDAGGGGVRRRRRERGRGRRRARARTRSVRRRRRRGRRGKRRGGTRHDASPRASAAARARANV